MFKKGILTISGARRLGVPHLAQQIVDYEPKHHKEIGEYAGEILHQGERLGSTMALGDDGILPCNEDTNDTTLQD